MDTPAAPHARHLPRARLAPTGPAVVTEFVVAFEIAEGLRVADVRSLAGTDRRALHCREAPVPRSLRVAGVRGPRLSLQLGRGALSRSDSRVGLSPTLLRDLLSGAHPVSLPFVIAGD